MEELAGVLADPGLLAGAVLKALQDGLLVEVEEAAFQVDAHAVAEHAFDTLAGIRGGNEAVGDLVGYHRGLDCGCRHEGQRA